MRRQLLAVQVALFFLQALPMALQSAGLPGFGFGVLCLAPAGSPVRTASRVARTPPAARLTRRRVQEAGGTAVIRVSTPVHPIWTQLTAQSWRRHGENYPFLRAVLVKTGRLLPAHDAQDGTTDRHGVGPAAPVWRHVPHVAAGHPLESRLAIIAFVHATSIPYAQKHASRILHQLDQTPADQSVVQRSFTDDAFYRSLTLACVGLGVPLPAVSRHALIPATQSRL